MFCRTRIPSNAIVKYEYDVAAAAALSVPILTMRLYDIFYSFLQGLCMDFDTELIIRCLDLIIIELVPTLCPSYFA